MPSPRGPGGLNPYFFVIKISLSLLNSFLIVVSGVPGANELIEGVPVIRQTAEGIVEYINFQGVLYKNVFTKV